MKEADPKRYSEDDFNWIVAGYVCVVASLVLCPPLFGVAGFFIGKRNQDRGIEHGGVQMGLAVVCGLVGMCIGAFLSQ